MARDRHSGQINRHSGWAMAVGGMIGGGIYTLAGVILGVAGPLAWVSLILGTLVALITVRSYFVLTLRLRQEAVPVSLLFEKGLDRFAGTLAWWLIIVYVLAMAVYAFTFGHYIGRALGMSKLGIALLTTALITMLMGVNVVGIKEPAGVQVAAVWVELLILASLAAVGFWHWNPQNLTAGVPSGSLMGVLAGMAGTFIAFEGFEMLVYDFKELKHPRQTLGTGLVLAVIAVGAAYALVTLGAASLVGAQVLVAQKENALAVAGAKAAGKAGLIVVTVAACASGASAINSTLFSVSRLARAAAERGLMPRFFGHCNRKQCPHNSVLVIGVASSALAVSSTLDALVESASLAFLLLFGFVNFMAFWETREKRYLPLAGAIAAAVGAIIVSRMLFQTHPWMIAGFIVLCVTSAGAHLISRRRRTPQARVPGDPALAGAEKPANESPDGIK